MKTALKILVLVAVAFAFFGIGNISANRNCRKEIERCHRHLQARDEQVASLDVYFQRYLKNRDDANLRFLGSRIEVMKNYWHSNEANQ